MNVYYISSSNSNSNNNNNNNKYNFLDIKESNRSISELQKVIMYTPNFCRENQSITTSELKSYIVSGITFFTRNTLNQITGLINFDINQTVMNVLGICVPGLSIGVGSYLINLVKQFAKANNLLTIKLTCYDNLKYFYLKQDFKVVNESVFYDSDSDSDSEDQEMGKTRYTMVFDLKNYVGGIKRRKKTNIKRRRTVTKRKNFISRKKRNK